MLHIITGPMFAEKTEELIRLYVRKRIASNITGASAPRMFVPVEDTRWEGSGKFMKGYAVSRSGSKVEATILCGMVDILLCDSLFIDEVWMRSMPFIKDLVRAHPHREITCTALNCFASGTPIETTNYLLSHADKITMLSNICSKCGKDGSRTGYSGPEFDGDFKPGDGCYFPVCSKCSPQAESLK